MIYMRSIRIPLEPKAGTSRANETVTHVVLGNIDGNRRSVSGRAEVGLEVTHPVGEKGGTIRRVTGWVYESRRFVHAQEEPETRRRGQGADWKVKIEGMDGVIAEVNGGESIHASNLRGALVEGGKYLRANYPEDPALLPGVVRGGAKEGR